MSNPKNNLHLVISSVVMLLCLLWMYWLVSEIHSPVAPALVNVPIGSQNRTETLVIAGNRYGISSEAFVVRKNVTLQTLPRTAWCDQYRHPDRTRELFLVCAWPTPEQPVRFAAALIEVPTPRAEGLERWVFNRETLQARPIMSYWLFFNFSRLLFLLIAAVIGLIALFWFMEVRIDQKKQHSATI